MEIYAGAGAARWLYTVAAGLLLLLAALLELPLRWLPDWPSGWVLLPLLPVGLAAWRHVPRWTNSLQGYCRNGTVFVRCGVLWHWEQYIPMNVLQAFEIWEPPLHRVFGCCTVVLRVAGGCVLLPLLERATADRLAREWDQTEEAS